MASDAPIPIAIIGTGCRLPGGISNASTLWETLLNPPDLVKDVPPERFRWEGIHRSDGRHNGIKTKSAYWLEDNIRHFDPHFFAISPSEAESMDPQQRLLLECVYEAMESAGLTLQELRGSDAGVFVGQMFDDYHELAVVDSDAASAAMLTTGTVRSITANRISHVFDFRGPSIAIDTACSSSMAAVHLAVESLRRGESRVAFACGANLSLRPTVFKAGSRLGMFSADGRSKMFDESADGYARGEGIGVLCLKQLDLAIQDGDVVECVIRQTGTNHDGRARTLTAPSAEAQARLIRWTYEHAGLDLSDSSSRPQYFEAHGTGTRVGDPAEAEAVETAFFPTDQEPTEDEQLYVGSIKSIIGHTEGAAGIAGILRASLALQHGTIPPNLHFNRMNPKVAARGKHLQVPTEPQPWPSLPEGSPRRVSVNSFGFGGSNVHAILESFQQVSPSNPSSSDTSDSSLFMPFTFSGISEKALLSTLQVHLGYLEQKKEKASLRNLAWTLQQKRSQFEYRCSIAAQNHTELTGLLAEKMKLLRIQPATGAETHTNATVRCIQDKKPHILAIFTGQGAQYATMGKKITEASSYARSIIKKLDNALYTLPASDRPSWRIMDELLRDETESRVDETTISQTLTTAVQVLLVSLLKVAKIPIKIVIGHSSGEIAAAFAAGVISAEDAILNAYYRGLHSSSACDNGNQGTMLAASMSAGDAAAFCNLPQFAGRIKVAAVNSPYDVTISGDADAIADATIGLDDRGISAKRLSVDVAYHSRHMQICSGPYKKSLEGMHAIPTSADEEYPSWYSSVSPGVQLSSTKADYWVKNMCRPVMFKDAITAAINKTGMPDLILEIGPRPVLETAVRRTITGMTDRMPLYTGLLRRGSDAVSSVSEVLGLIWSHFGREAVDMARFDRTLADAKPPTLVKDLPTYRWEHDREYWNHSRYMRKELESTTPPSELVGSEVHLSGTHEAKWRKFITPKQIPWILDHRIDGSIVLPAAAYVMMVVAAVEKKSGDRGIASIDTTDLELRQPIVFANEYTKIEIVMTIHDLNEVLQGSTGTFAIDFCADQANGDLLTAARGCFHARFGKDVDRAYPELFEQPKDLTDVKPETFCHHATANGLSYKGPFQNVIAAQRRLDFATGEITMSPSELAIHPAVLDGLFQGTNIAADFPGDSALPNTVVPSHIKRLTIFPTRCQEIASRGPSISFQAMSTGNRESCGVLYSDGFGVAVQLDGLMLKPYRLTTADDDVKMYSEVTWEPVDSTIEKPKSVTADTEEPNSPQDSFFSGDSGSEAGSVPASTAPHKSKESLMIVGDYKNLAKDLEFALSSTFDRVIHVSSLDDITDDMEISYAVLSIVDLVDSIFLNMTATKWNALQRLLTEATNVLWATTGVKSPKTLDQVHANTIVGLARSVRHELRHLRLNILDIHDPAAIDARDLADVMVHWYTLGQSNAESGKEKTPEHCELSYEAGAIYVPVIHRVESMNDRYNSQHRKIARVVDPGKEPLEVVRTDAQRYALRAVLHAVRDLSLPGEVDCMSVRITHCTQYAFKIKGLGFLHIGITESADGKPVLVALDRASSSARVSQQLAFPCALPESPKPMLLNNLVATLVALTVFGFVHGSSGLLVVCSDEMWISEIKREAARRVNSGSVTILSGTPSVGSDEAIYIHSSALDVSVRAKVPTNVSTVVNLSNRAKDEILFERLTKVVEDRQITFKNKDMIFRDIASIRYKDNSISTAALKLLEEAAATQVDLAVYHSSASTSNDPVGPQQLVTQSNCSPSTVVDWTKATSIKVPVTPATNTVRFSPNKTYLIVGSSEIARSICEWMSSSGARFFVMVSRNPDSVASWTSDMAQKGITVNLHSTDITSENSVNDLVATIKASTTEIKKPLGGVIHLATSIKDTAFPTMSYTDFCRVADVKAKGSLNLHNALSAERLDFFILTSSLSYIIGNPGQANYNAGNAFMTSLARYRRSIGLPASVVHLGTVVGIGYMARQESTPARGSLLADQYVRKGAYPISERDLRQIFAEAVM
ncbi:ketoacyl-synt-domain-containing protein, partial [Bimuria novae-zelandiae CBS 107.79]